MKNSKIFESNKFIYGIFLILLILFFCRCINIEQDLPPWGTINYQPVDEGSYALLALNMQNYGTIKTDSNVSDYVALVPPYARTNVIGNVACFIGLKILGDNYYGLRVPYVIFGALNYTLIFIILLKITKKYDFEKKQSNILICLLMIMLLFDYVFFVASRVVEPSMVRMTFLLLIILCELSFENNRKFRYFLIGLLTSVSIFFVYITNTFFVLSYGLFFLYLFITNKYKKSIIHYVILYFLGFILSYLIINYYYTYWNTNGINNMLISIMSFSDIPSYAIKNNFINKLKNIINYFTNNCFLYNIIIVFQFFLILPHLCIKAFKQKDEFVFFLMAVMLSLLFQTIFSEDFIVRKYIIVYPILLFCLYIGAIYICNTKAHKKRRTVKQIIYILFVNLFVFCIIIYRLYLINNNTNLDFNSFHKNIIWILGYLPTVVFSLIIAINLYIKKIDKYKINVISIMIIINVIFNVIFIANYFCFNVTFTEKKAMIKIKELADGQYILGQFQNGYTLYNDIKPVLNDNKSITKYVDSNQDLLYFDYADVSKKDYLEKIVFKDSKYTAEKIFELERNFQTFGKQRNMALYKIVLKKEKN